MSMEIAKYFMWIGDKPGREKITVGGNPGYHFTLMWNGRERALNLHKTIDSSDSKPLHVPLFKIKLFTLLRFLVLYSRINGDIIKKYQGASRINIGKLKRYHLTLLPTKFSEEQRHILIDVKRKKKLKIKSEINQEAVFSLYKQPDEIMNIECNKFIACSTRKGRLRMEGIIWRGDGEANRKSYYFLKRRNINIYTKELSIAMVKILRTLPFENKKEILIQMENNLREQYPTEEY